jgi:hypothetical protein
MRGFPILVCASLMLGAVSAYAGVTDPASMASAIRQAGSECNEVKSMTKDPKEARVYHVVCDGGTKYRVMLQPDDTVVIESE